MNVDQNPLLAWMFGLPGTVVELLSGMFGPGSRFFLPYLAIALIIAVVGYFINKKNMGEHAKRGALSYIFNPAVFFNASSLVDLKIVLANRLFIPGLAIINRGIIAVFAAGVASALLGENANTIQSNETPPIALLVLVTLAITLASDLTTYFVHRFHHEKPVLWPFHKVHHSAESLTPLTFLRKHPVYDLTRVCANAFLVAPIQGIIFAVFGITSFATILGVNIFYAIFHWAGSNLRHSHIWISYGPFWNKIFISPAQHQIHHSRAARHHDKNYGEVFALWDWMFGTLYEPEKFEALDFGVADKDGNAIEQPHPTLKDAWLVPFKESIAAMKGRNNPAAENEINLNAAPHR